MEAHNQLEPASVSLMLAVVIYTHNNGNKLELKNQPLFYKTFLF